MVKTYYIRNAVGTLVSATCPLHLTVAFVWCICRAVGPPPRASTDASPGAGSRVRGEPCQSLQVSWYRFCAGQVGATCNLDYILNYTVSFCLASVLFIMYIVFHVVRSVLF